MYQFNPLAASAPAFFTTATNVCCTPAAYPLAYMIQNQPIMTTSSLVCENKMSLPCYSSYSTEIPVYGYAPIGSLRLKPIAVKTECKCKCDEYIKERVETQMKLIQVN